MTQPRLSFLSPIGRFYLTPEAAGESYQSIVQNPLKAYRQGFAVPAMSTLLKGKFQFESAKELRALLTPMRKELKTIELPEVELQAMEALRTGDEVHTAIESDLKGEVVNIERLGSYAQPFYQGYEKFRASITDKTLKAVEQTYYIHFADGLRLGGTSDVVYAEQVSSKSEPTSLTEQILVLDWKTGKTPPDLFKSLLQCTGLGFAELIVHNGKTFQMKKRPQKFGVVWLRTDGGFSLIDTSDLDIQNVMHLAWDILSVKVSEFHDSMNVTVTT